MDWISGKNVIVTGASSGLGRALTIQLIKEKNCRVIGIGQSKPKMMSLIDELSYLRGSFLYYLFDVSEPDAWESFAAELRTKDISVDLLINNAGMMPPFDKSVSYNEEIIHRCFSVNFHACRYAIKTMLPFLENSTMPGIVNISSADALLSLTGTGIYGAAKAALKAYTESLIGELGRKLYIAYVCPGFIRTDIFRNQYIMSADGIVNRLASSPDKTARKIIKKLEKQKHRIIVGKDAHFMNFSAKFFPMAGLKLFERILKNSKNEMFHNIRY